MNDLLKELQQFVKRKRKLKHWKSYVGICSNTCDLKTNDLDFMDYLIIAHKRGLINDVIIPCNKTANDYLRKRMNLSLYKGEQKRKRLRLARKIIKLIRQRSN